jgi:hypothetical protein
VELHFLCSTGFLFHILIFVSHTRNESLALNVICKRTKRKIMTDVYLMVFFLIGGVFALALKLKLFKVSKNEQYNAEFHRKYGWLFLIHAIISFLGLGVYLYEFISN